VNKSKTANHSPEKIQKEGRRLEKTDFTYHDDGDYYTCPMRQRLTFIRKNTQRNRPGRQYRASSCDDCRLKTQCLASYNKSGLRNIFRDDKEHLAEKMRQKLQTEDAKQKLKLRSITVEPVIGNLKSNLGFRRFNLMTLPNVKGEFTLMCIAHNLNKLYGLLFYFYFLIFFKIYHSDLDNK